MQSSILEIINLENPVFRGYVFYSSILVLKTMAMSPLTGRQRYIHQRKNGSDMNDGILEILNLQNPVFKGYVFYSSVLVLKMLAMAALTARQRFKHKAFANPEDAGPRKVKPKVEESVERVRRAHLNDLENIPIFFVAGLGYMLTGPPAATALMLFRVFTIARCLHTLVYAVVVVPQPARAVSWATGYLITGFMAVKTALHFF